MRGAVAGVFLVFYPRLPALADNQKKYSILGSNLSKFHDDTNDATEAIPPKHLWTGEQFTSLSAGWMGWGWLSGMAVGGMMADDTLDV